METQTATHQNGVDDIIDQPDGNRAHATNITADDRSPPMARMIAVGTQITNAPRKGTIANNPMMKPQKNGEGRRQGWANAPLFRDEPEAA
jgi:hypothetical protein